MTQFTSPSKTLRCDSESNCIYTSMVVLAFECRMSACASFTSAPFFFNFIANERRSTCQFTHGIPNNRAAGLMCLARILLSRIGAPFATDCARFHLDHYRSQPLDTVDHRPINWNSGVT